MIRNQTTPSERINCCTGILLIVFVTKLEIELGLHIFHPKSQNVKYHTGNSDK